MAVSERAARFAITILRNPYIPHKPTERQATFLSDPSIESFYGGAAGGGKTDALLMAALQYVEYPNYRGLLLRTTYQDLALPESLMDRARQWLEDTDAHWKADTKTWQFPSGATITFGYLNHENDKFRYKSAEFQFVGFDELTQFSETQYTYLFSRLRRLAGSVIPIRMRSASNPGDMGHDWVKARFIEPSKEQLKTERRCFVPAKLEDNPYLDTTEYEDSLSKLDPVTHEQLRHGDWDITLQGELFKRQFFPIVETGMQFGRRVRYWDFAATEELDKRKTNGPDWTVGFLLGRVGDTYIISDIIRVRKGPGDVEALVKQTAIMDGKQTIIGIEEEGGSAGKMVSAAFVKLLKGWRTIPVRNTGSKIDRARPVATEAAKGTISVKKAPWNADFFQEIERFPSSKVPDDQVDGFSGAYALHQALPGQGKKVEFASNKSGFSPQWKAERPF